MRPPMLSFVLCRSSPSTLQASFGRPLSFGRCRDPSSGSVNSRLFFCVEARYPRYRRLQATSVLCSLSGHEQRVRQQSFVVLCRGSLSTLQASSSDLSPLFVIGTRAAGMSTVVRSSVSRLAVHATCVFERPQSFVRFCQLWRVHLFVSTFVRYSCVLHRRFESESP
ncbi:hypothetical protein GN958_ATG07142 [Phytophthora infestans]|uniref:Uncharacterized protein n=1 Tax=Phytophthora infestans TaxID=4787 RepID=A0A8S9USI8_PHYIN|nr:hypothetical protein GN958_ATG07142 [Phytophthora infestans]